MSDNAEYDQLVSEHEYRKAEYVACENRIDECNYLLERLRAARDDVSALKDRFRDEVRSKDKKLKKEDFQWTGKKFNSYETKMVDLVDINEKYYDDTLDFVLDSLNTEITNVKNRRNDEYGILGWIGDRINNLGNMIVNFFN